MSNEAICEWCGKEFWLSRKNRKYCSISCARYARHKRRTDYNLEHPKYVFLCNFCGKEIRTNDKRRKFCNSKCNWNYQNAKRKTTKEETRKCPVCCKLFKPMQKRGVGKKYCSIKCRNKHAYQKHKNSSKSKNWNWRKQNKFDGNWFKALKRDKFTCQICGKQIYPSQWISNKTRLEVHHKDGTGENTKNHDLENLLTLCSKCHKLFHVKINLIKINEEYFVKGEIFKILNLKSIKTL